MTTLEAAARADSPAPAVGALSLRQRLGYCVADYGFNLFYASLNAFLLYYYTDVLGITPTIAGLIFALALFWDAITDPIMGVIADKTRTRFGRYRAFIAFGALPLGLSFIAMFAAPVFLPGAVVFAAAATHGAFRTAYTVVSIPFTALSAAMTRDSGERGVLAGGRIVFAALAGLTVSFLTLNLAEGFGGGDERIGFIWVSVLYAAIACAILLFTFTATRENDPSAEDAPPALMATLRALPRNSAALIVIAATVISVTGSTLFGKSFVYYVKYASAVEIDIGAALGTMSAATLLSLPLWIFASTRLEKRTVWVLGLIISTAAMGALFVFPPQSLAPLLACLTLIGVGSGAVFVTFWSMLPDTVEFGEWRTGVRSAGFLFGLMQLAVKATSAVGVGMTGVLLDQIGYVANAEQSVETLAALKLLTFAAPIALFVASFAVIAAYPIDRRTHARLVAGLARRGRGLAP